MTYTEQFIMKQKMNVKILEVIILLTSNHMFILGRYYFILPSSVKFSHKSPQVSPKQSRSEGRTTFFEFVTHTVKLELHLQYQSFSLSSLYYSL